MHMTRVMYTTSDRPFELVDIYYRADKYHYSVNMVRVKRQGSGRGRPRWKRPRDAAAVPASRR